MGWLPSTIISCIASINFIVAPFESSARLVRNFHSLPSRRGGGGEETIKYLGGKSKKRGKVSLLREGRGEGSVNEAEFEIFRGERERGMEGSLDNWAV